MSDWKEYKWGDLVSLEYGKSLSNYRDSTGDIPVFGTNGPIGFTEKALCTFPSVVIGRKGAYRGVHYSDRPFFVIDTAFYVKPRVDYLNLKFAYYYLLTLDINSMDSGSAIPSTSRDDFYELPARIPDVYTQTAIAEILSSVDDKIKLNNQINKNLEALAQALFKQWFVDFEFPNENGQPYKSSGGEMVESELGLIPKGWEVKRLSELINITGGGTPKRANSEFWDGNIPWFSVQDVPAESQIVVVNTKEKITELGLNNSSTRILPVGTTIITARGTVGKLALVAEPMAMNQSCYGINGKDEIGTYFNYYNLKLAVTALQQNTHGAVFDTITTGTFDTVKVSFGNIDLTKEFDKVVKDWFFLIKYNVKENQYLSSLRDSLLPKLISGELELF